eukprot:PhM_4_TR13351/c2_g1_i1/m.14030
MFHRSHSHEAGPVLSIDLGTENARVFFWSSSEGRVRPIPSVSQPSLVALRGHILHIGKEARKIRDGSNVPVVGGSKIENVDADAVFNVHVTPSVGEAPRSTYLRDGDTSKELPCEVVIALLLNKIKEATMASEKVAASSISCVVITVPAVSRICARLRVKKAAAIAGFKTAYVCSTTLASAMYVHASLQGRVVSELNADRRVAIIDIGARFTAATDAILSFHPNNRLDVIRHDGVVWGGYDITKLLGRCMKEHDEGCDVSVRECDNVKKELSTQVMAMYELMDRRRRTARRSEFENYSEKHVRDALAPLLMTVFPDPKSISLIVLLGGSSRVPLVTRVVKEHFAGGPAKFESLDVDYGVGIGAALLGAAVWAAGGNNSDISLSCVPLPHVHNITNLIWSVHDDEKTHNHNNIADVAQNGSFTSNRVVASPIVHLYQDLDVVGSVTLIDGAAQVGLDREGLLYGDTYVPPPDLTDNAGIVSGRAVLLTEVRRMNDHRHLATVRNALDEQLLVEIRPTTDDGRALFEDLSALLDFANDAVHMDGVAVDLLQSICTNVKVVMDAINAPGGSNNHEQEIAIAREALAALKDIQAEVLKPMRSEISSPPRQHSHATVVEARTDAMTSSAQQHPQQHREVFTRTFTLYTPTSKYESTAPAVPKLTIPSSAYDPPGTAKSAAAVVRKPSPKKAHTASTYTHVNGNGNNKAAAASSSRTAAPAKSTSTTPNTRTAFIRSASAPSAARSTTHAKLPTSATTKTAPTAKSNHLHAQPVIMNSKKPMMTTAATATSSKRVVVGATRLRAPPPHVTATPIAATSSATSPSQQQQQQQPPNRSTTVSALIMRTRRTASATPIGGNKGNIGVRASSSTARASSGGDTPQRTTTTNNVKTRPASVQRQSQSTTCTAMPKTAVHRRTPTPSTPSTASVSKVAVVTRSATMTTAPQKQTAAGGTPTPTTAAGHRSSSSIPSAAHRYRRSTTTTMPKTN